MMLSRRNLLTAGLVFVTVWMLGLLSGCASPAPKMASVANGVKRVDLGSVTITKNGVVAREVRLPLLLK